MLRKLRVPIVVVAAMALVAVCVTSASAVVGSFSLTGDYPGYTMKTVAFEPGENIEDLDAHHSFYNSGSTCEASGPASSLQCSSAVNPNCPDPTTRWASWWFTSSQGSASDGEYAMCGDSGGGLN